MSALTVVAFVVGLILLVAGAELLVRGASRLATAVGISPLVVGLTVVAFGTSAPEMAVSVQSSLAGQSDVAVGNVIGSNIANILLILGCSALAAPLIVSRQLTRLDVPLMVGASLLVYGLAWNGRLSQLESGFLFLVILSYIAYSVYQSRREGRAKLESLPGLETAPPPGAKGIVWNILLVAAGLGLLVFGADLLVDAAVTVAEFLGVSKLIIGLTIVAVGTSLPELATSVVASLRGEREIAVGNVVGSNLFNLLAVLGLAGAVTPGGMIVSQQALQFDMAVMTAVALLCLPIFFSGDTISRKEGALFSGYYVAYIAYLILATTQHPALPLFQLVMGWIVIPATVVGLLFLTVKAVGRRRRTTDDRR
jgi:cation:H+ antiporter